MTLQDFFGRGLKDTECEAQEKLLDENKAATSSDSLLFFAIQLAMVVLTGLFASTGIDLGPINNYAGIASFAQTIIMPGILWKRMLQLDGEWSWMLVIHVVLGAAPWLLTLALTGNHLDSISKHCSVWWPQDA